MALSLMKTTKGPATFRVAAPFSSYGAKRFVRVFCGEEREIRPKRFAQ